MTTKKLRDDRQSWTTPSAVQPPVSSTDARTWLEPWIELEEDIETVGPDRKLIVYTAPRELRPLKVSPIVRWMSWPAAQRSDLEHGPKPQISYYEVDAPFDTIEAGARDLSEALIHYPYTIDSLDPTRDINLPEMARTWRCAKWDTRLTHVDLRWTVGSVEQLDGQWAKLWDCIASKIQGQTELAGWQELYDD